MRKVLVLGGSGLIGKALINEMSKYDIFDCYLTYYKNPVLVNKDKSFKLNVEDEDNIMCILNIVKPHIVVSCLRGNFYKQLIMHIKTAEYLKKNGGKLYFFSTTNVFDNDLSRPHNEEDLPNSRTEYGKYKIECEKIIAEILGDNSCILRIPQVFGKNSPRMIELLKSINNNKEIVVYPNLYCNSNTDVMIAKQLLYIINNNLNGIFHLVSEDVVNYKDFYNELISSLGFKNPLIKEDFEENGYFALVSKRKNEFPKELRITNKSVINYLTK